MKPTIENSFLNLSKLSEEQKRKVIALLPEEKIECDYDINEVCYFLIYEEDEVKWSVLHNFWIKGKQELTYTQFIEMMGGENKEVLLVENKITRFEFITKENGREIVRYGEFTFQIQDNGKTLKVFQENKSNN